MRRTGWYFQADNLYRYWSFGFELYRHPTRFSRGAGPEYGFYLFVGTYRVHVSYSRPFRVRTESRNVKTAPGFSEGTDFMPNRVDRQI